MEGLLSRKGSLILKLSTYLEWSYLFPLRTLAANALDPKYLRSDGSWPQALPKPGVYVTDRGDNAFVGYTSDTFRIDLPIKSVPARYKQIDVQVASAFVFPLEEQIYLDYDDYMAYEEGLQGDPCQLNDLHVFHLPAQIGDIDNLRTRAWYSPCPPTYYPDARWKVAVVSEDELFLILDNVVMNPWHLRRRRDIT